MQQLHMLVFSLVLFWISHPVNALETVYGAEGDDIVLTPPLQSPSPPITSIQWKHGEDIIAEWYEVYGNETNCLKFKGRCKLSLLTGALTITGLTKTDSGIYNPEINNKYLDSTHLIVISRVPKPSISKSCNTEMTACNLTCEGNTIESEPVDCKWLLDEAVGPSGKVLTITKEMKEQSYRCVFVNPVGNKTSDIMTNPLLKVENVHSARIRWLTAAGVFLVLLVLGLIAAYLIYKRKPGSYGFVPTKEEDNNVIEVHVPPTTQDSDSLCNGSVIPEEQRASNEPSDSIPLQSVCNGAGKASEISSNNDLTTSTSPEAGKEADITSEMGPESPQDSITPETGKETEITSDVVEKSDENSTTPASPASSQETGDLATKPPDQEQTNQEPPAAEQEADDAGDLDEH